MPRKALRRHLSTVYADKPGDLDEGIKRNTQGQPGRGEVPLRMQQRPQILGQKGGILEPQQGQQVEHQGKNQQTLAAQAEPAASLLARTAQAGLFVIAFRVLSGGGILFLLWLCLWRCQGKGKGIVHAQNHSQQNQEGQTPQTVKYYGKSQQHQGKTRGPVALGQPPAYQQQG